MKHKSFLFSLIVALCSYFWVSQPALAEGAVLTGDRACMSEPSFRVDSDLYYPFCDPHPCDPDDPDYDPDPYGSSDEPWYI